ncbi:hybrid sensor histidine kinase/response regulator [Desulfolithobacter sp.]
MKKEQDNGLILIVDDDDNFRDLLAQFLKNQGYRVREAEDGRQALKFIGQTSPDLILMDADMPGMDGFTTCAEITGSPEGKELPVIVVTAYQDEASVDRAFDAGAVDFVTKPIHWAVLRRRIRNFIALSQSRKTLQAAEEARKKAEEQLLRAQKMEAIGLMASGVAHDLNNILSGIVGYPELMLRRLPEDSPLLKPLTAIQESGRRAATVVADLLTIARGAASTREVCDLHKLIREYLSSPECQNLRSHYPEVTITLRLEAERSHISCSPIHIKKCLMNLVDNGAEAIVGQGSVTVRTWNLSLDGSMADMRQLARGEYVVLEIQDTGTGISDTDLEHIFEPFYTRKTMGRSGSGLGLTVVWNTVEDHGGKIFVTSSDLGTSFQLFFPLSGSKELIQADDKLPEEVGGRGEHILVVDDEPDLRDIACSMLRALGYRVDAVDSGESAIEFIHETPVDLILIDMLMEPGMNGRQTYEKILEIRPGQKAIIASGFAGNDDVRAALRLGAGGFIKKPYSMDQLGKAVKRELLTTR